MANLNNNLVIRIITTNDDKIIIRNKTDIIMNEINIRSVASGVLG